MLNWDTSIIVDMVCFKRYLWKHSNVFDIDTNSLCHSEILFHFSRLMEVSEILNSIPVNLTHRHWRLVSWLKIFIYLFVVLFNDVASISHYRHVASNRRMINV
jgi:hypothetical protein